jgi:hypothetical protein
MGQFLGIGRDEAANIKRIRLSFIGRNISNFSDGGVLDERAAWGHWPQVLRLARETKLRRSDRGLFEALKEDTPKLRLPSFAPEDHDEIELRASILS